MLIKLSSMSHRMKCNRLRNHQGQIIMRLALIEFLLVLTLRVLYKHQSLIKTKLMVKIWKMSVIVLLEKALHILLNFKAIMIAVIT